MNLGEAVDTAQGVVTLASELPQVPLDLKGEAHAETDIDTILEQMRDLYQQWRHGVDSEACPKCGARIERKVTRRWLFSKQIMFLCNSCGFETTDENEYNRMVGEQTAKKVVALTKYMGLAGLLMTRIRDYVQKGKLSLLCGDVESLILKHDEQAVIAVPVVLLTERAVRYSKTQQTSSPNRTYVGGSFRVAKGAYIHLGGSVGQQRKSESISRSVSELFPKDWGSLVVTNRRCMFIGDNMSATSFDLTKLVSLSLTEMEEGRDSMMFQVASRQRPIIIMLQDVAFQPGGAPWPLIHPQMGINAKEIAARIKSLVSAS